MKFRISKHHQSCKTLPLNLFLDIIDGGKLSLLNIRGKSRSSELEDAWENIFKEYQDLTGNKGADKTLERIKNLSILNVQVDILSKALISLAMGYHKDTIRFINSNGIRTKIRRKSFNKDFKRAQSELKSMKFYLKTQQDQIKGISKRANNIREDFTSLLLQLSQFLGYKYDTKNHTVFEFAVAVKAMNNHFKQLKKQQKNKTDYGKRA